MIKQRLELKEKQQSVLNAEQKKLIEEEKNATELKTKMLSKIGQCMLKNLDLALEED